MTENLKPITLAGSIETLLSHMALLGVAHMVEEAYGAGTVRLRWTDSADARPQLAAPSLDSEVLGVVVRDHARHHVEDATGWMHRKAPEYGALFSARTKVPSTEAGWEELLGIRQGSLRPLRGLDSAMILGIGERAWWHRNDQRLRPDHGASAWEMRTRNKGMEFVTHALLPAGRAVAAREAAAVTSGLLGETLVDEPGKGKSDSRTATGLAPLGPVDAARAWAGLWGLASLPVWADAHDVSTSTASIRPMAGHPGRLLMPVPTSWVTLSRFTAALRSRHLVEMVHASSQTEALVGALGVEVAPLASWGFGHILAFPVLRTGSTSAPERRALSGKAVA